MSGFASTTYNGVYRISYERPDDEFILNPLAIAPIIKEDTIAREIFIEWYDTNRPKVKKINDLKVVPFMAAGDNTERHLAPRQISFNIEYEGKKVEITFNLLTIKDLKEIKPELCTEKNLQTDEDAQNYYLNYDESEHYAKVVGIILPEGW